LGKTHVSSEVHEKVIADLEGAGEASPHLEALRSTAERARNAVYAADFDELGRSMTDNTEEQRGLHPDLVSEDAQEVIDIAKAHGALGWKVNGAGGEGGSLTLMAGPSASARRSLLREITKANPLFQPIPTYLSRFGLRVWEGGGRDGKDLGRNR
ncbi:MAG TPA: GHMP kinase, partial [Actinomycetota bacterium]|nr:GHMP kinase [Actinomycetota bacterium]